MKISIDNALGAHAEALALRAVRSQVLAENIANADTPGYQPRDLDFRSALTARLDPSQRGLQRTAPGHLTGSAGSAEGAAELLLRRPLLDSLDDNGVNLQQEQAAFAENSLQLQASFNFVDRRLRGMINALKGE